MGKTTRVWAFDLGKGSIGEAVRLGNKILHSESLLIPGDFAATGPATSRRRMARTREAHKAREHWLGLAMQSAGIEPLAGRRTEKVNGRWRPAPETAEQRLNRERLEREFPKQGDATCYTSCLLRIRLLRGEELEPWQIYKALHSAIQRRGYDPDLPWKGKQGRKAGRKDEKDEDAEGTAARMHAFEEELERMAPGKPAFHFPCYFDAWKMGLWRADRPEELKPRIDCLAQTTRNQIVPRRLVEKEVRALLEAAANQHPALQNQADYVLYGPAREAYASYKPVLRKKFGLREGGATDWQGVLSQKIPRFDNRIVEKCILIPRMNVCKVDVRQDKNGASIPESLLASEATFLMKLKNMRFQRNGVPDGLTADEIRMIWENPKRKKLSFTKSEWEKLCEKISGTPLPGYEEVAAPKASGRSRFCRPALGILKRLILSGQTPREFYQNEVLSLNGNKYPAKGLVKEDLNFLLQMGEAWGGIYIPNQKLEALIIRSEGRDEAIRALIGSQNDPIVRHRLTMFSKRLALLEEKFGTPDHIVLEFVREDFMGKKAKLELMRFQRERAAQRALARKEAAEAGATERAAGLKMELLRAQGGVCLYTGEGLIPEKLDEYDIDHIVPRTKGGPDAAVNYVLTRGKTNREEKGERTPFEWLSGTTGWDAYVNRVRSRSGTLRNKKVQLLTSPNAEELVQKYTALAETAWISKLAQAVISIHFGWNQGNESGTRRITVVSGGLTGRIRRQYHLNSILSPSAKDQEEAEKKNRDDARHHALDAMVISFIPNWARDPKKEGFFRFPDEIQKNARGFFEKAIEGVIPRNHALEAAPLEETLYGVREVQGKKYAVGRESLLDLAVRVSNNKRTLKAQKDIETHRIVDPCIRRDVEAFLNQNSDLSLESWTTWCNTYRLGTNGPMVRRALMTKSKGDSLAEYADLSKDGTGQLRRGAKHQGYFVYQYPAPTKKEPHKKRPEVRPVYAFESRAKVLEEIRQIKGATLVGYFQSGCQIQTKNDWDFRNDRYPAGQYICTSIWANRNAKLRHPRYGEIGPVGLGILLEAGLERVKQP